MRVLLVENDAVTLEAATAVLSLNGHEVCRAVTGSAALDYLRETVPDLILLDLCLPDATGTSLLDALREHVRPSVPIVVATASAAKEIESVPASVPVLRKPFAPEVLLGILVGLQAAKGAMAGQTSPSRSTI